MNEEEFKTLIKKDRYQVFVFSSRAMIPLSFARHTWIVGVNKGKISRWEILFLRDYKGKEWGHLHLNALKPARGMRIFLYKKHFFWKSKLIGTLEGKKGSTAEKMNVFLKNCPKEYPFTHKYVLPSPDSNTFTQWVLNKFPEVKIKLPWTAFGKNHKI